MELGNMIFGNSRGEACVPRDSSFEGPWQELCEELKISGYGHPEDGCPLPTNDSGYIDTPIFAVRPYDWDAECDCGADGKMEKWFSANAHSANCYQSELRREMDQYDRATGFRAIEAAAFGRDDSPLPGMEMEEEEVAPGVTVMTFEPRSDAAMDAWRKASDLRRTHEDATYKRLCHAHNLTYPSGCAVHCDCGRDERGDIFWTEIGGHASTCRFVQPNFLYKPNGFRINWYKYPFRDSYMTPGISAKEWRKIIRHCIESAAHG